MANAEEVKMRDRWKGKSSEERISIGKKIQRIDASSIILRFSLCFCLVTRVKPIRAVIDSIRTI